jgi:hypothetical protein
MSEGFVCSWIVKKTYPENFSNENGDLSASLANTTVIQGGRPDEYSTDRYAQSRKVCHDRMQGYVQGVHALLAGRQSHDQNAMIHRVRSAQGREQRLAAGQ